MRVRSPHLPLLLRALCSPLVEVLNGFESRVRVTFSLGRDGMRKLHEPGRFRDGRFLDDWRVWTRDCEVCGSNLGIYVSAMRFCTNPPFHVLRCTCGAEGTVTGIIDCA